MRSIFSRVLEAMHLGSKRPASPQLDFVNSIPSDELSCEPSSLGSPFTMTCEPSALCRGARACLSVGLPVSVRASARPSMATAMVRPCGPPCSVLPSSWRQNGLSWSSPPATRNGKPKCVMVWQELATTHPELSSRLRTLVRLISEGVCSFLPTPVSRDWRSPGLRSHSRLIASRGQPLPEIIGSRVHPELCEWLMGFPIGWTVMLPSKQSVIQTPQEWPPSSAAQS